VTAVAQKCEVENQTQSDELGRIMSHTSIKTNAFRILGVPTNGSLQTILERANELRAYLGIQKVPNYPSDYRPFALPERTLETLAAAVHRLEDPLMRLFDEATWFHIRDAVDASAEAAISEGSLTQAETIWEAGVRQATDTATRLHYRHNLAVLNLCASEIPLKSPPSPWDVWNRALSTWGPLLANDTFWQHLVAQSPAGRDSRCPTAAPQEVRRSVGHALARTCSRRAIEALGKGTWGDALAWATALATSQFPAGFTDPALHEVLETLGQHIRAYLEPLQVALQKPDQHNGEIERLGSRIDFARTIFQQFKPLWTEDTGALRSTADHLAESHRTLALYSANQAKDLTRALEHIEIAIRIASSEGLRIRLQQEAVVLNWNIANDAFKAAVQARDYAAAKDAFEKLEKYQSDEATLEPYLEALKALRILQDCQPISGTPPLFTIYGIGTKLYGRSGEDPENGTFLATLYLTVFFVPLIPLKRYRVRDLADGRYEFFGKTRLTNGQKAWAVAAAAACLMGIIFAGLEGHRSTPRPRAVYQTAPSPSPLESGAVLRAEIQRRRAALDSERGALEVEGQSIDREGVVLSNLRTEIEARRSLFPGGLPPTQDALVQQAVAEHNRRLEALRARVNAYNTRIDRWRREAAEFKALVDRYNANR